MQITLRRRPAFVAGSAWSRHTDAAAVPRSKRAKTFIANFNATAVSPALPRAAAAVAGPCRVFATASFAFRTCGDRIIARAGRPAAAATTLLRYAARTHLYPVAGPVYAGATCG